METLPSIQPNQEIQEKKKQAWANMGENVYKAELTLQAIAQESLKEIIHPAKIEDVPNAEAKLAQIKKDQKVVESKRKEITGPLDDLAKRLMQNEKSFDEPIKALSQSIISVKSAHEAKQRELKAKEDELKQIHHNISTYIANAEAAQLSKIEKSINNKFEQALSTIEPKDVGAFIDESLKLVNASAFAISNPILTSRYFAQEELQAIIIERMKAYNPERFVTEYEAVLRAKFSDYDVAFLNKAEALARSQKEEAEKQKAIEEEKRNKEIASSLEASAQVLTPSVSPSGVKELKRSYEVDMPETIDSVLIILSAFTANINLCLPKLKVNKWFAFTPAQAATALAKVKCDDNNFQPSGIIFKEIEKL